MHHHWLLRLGAALLCVLSILSVLTTVTFFTFVKEIARSHNIGLWDLAYQEIGKEYSYNGDINPTWLPMVPMKPIQMIAEETVHYSLNHKDEYEWLYNSPYGTGAVRVGPHHRGFFVSMFHQLHCIRYFQSEVHSKHEPEWPHLTHCLNYLRQMILCAGDLTLEPGDFTKRNFTTERLGETHMCRDWEAVYDDLTMNWIEWYKYRKQSNLTDLPAGSHTDHSS